jgi:phosphatidylglycerol:prolipoprotein diacylglycerol transferase
MTIPYIHVPDMQIGPIPLHPFGLLVATGVLLGTWITTWRARRLGWDVDLLNSFITWMLVAGFIGGHVFDEIFYHPDLIWKQPWEFMTRGPQTLLWLWTGLSSFGGFLGALLGILAWKYFEWLQPGEKGDGKKVIGRLWRRPYPMPLLPFADIVLSVFPIAWIFGRGGCTVVHDHPGARAAANSFFAVEYPGSGMPLKDVYGPIMNDKGEHLLELWHGNAPRFDLGLLEWFFTVVLATAIVLTWHKKLPSGANIVLIAFTYSPVRFVMDFLRITDNERPGEADIRYGQLTFAQYMCIALFAFGVALLLHIRKNQAKNYDPASLVMEPPDEDDEDDAPAPAKK